MKNGLKFLFSIVFFFLIKGLDLGSLFFFRSAVIDIFPASESIYEMVGITGPILGENLKLTVTKTSFESKSGKELLIVTGQIKNTVKEVSPVPLLRVTLYDAENNIVQTVDVPPKRTKLNPNRKIRFKAIIENPSPLARRAEVTFTVGSITDKKDKKP